MSHFDTRLKLAGDADELDEQYEDDLAGNHAPDNSVDEAPLSHFTKVTLPEPQLKMRQSPLTVNVEDLPPSMSENFRAILRRCVNITKNVRDALLTTRETVKDSNKGLAYREYAKERVTIKDSALARALQYKHRNKVLVVLLSLGIAIPTVNTLRNQLSETETKVDTRPNQQPEVCDNLDNNDNGIFDEGFNLQNDSMNCGICGHSCVTGKHCQSGFCQ